MRSRRFSTIIGSLVNSSNRYCHSQVSWPNVPLVTKNIPLEKKPHTKVRKSNKYCKYITECNAHLKHHSILTLRKPFSSIRWQKHSPFGDHEEVGVIDLGMSKVSVLGKTSILNFLKRERKKVREYLNKEQD